MEEEGVGTAGLDSARGLSLGRCGGDDGGLDDGRLLGGNCPAAFVLVVPGRLGGDGRVGLAPVTARAIGSGGVALGDGDRPGHLGGGGEGDVLLDDVASHSQRGSGGQDGEDALELHFKFYALDAISGIKNIDGATRRLTGVLRVFVGKKVMRVNGTGVFCLEENDKSTKRQRDGD